MILLILSKQLYRKSKGFSSGIKPTKKERGGTPRSFFLWAREPVKIWSEAEYFHKKPPAMRVVGKGL